MQRSPASAAEIVAGRSCKWRSGVGAATSEHCQPAQLMATRGAEENYIIIH